MNTLSDLKTMADPLDHHLDNVLTSTKDWLPEGTFTATCRVRGVPCVYLLRGAKDEPTAVILGRVEVLDAEHGRIYVGNLIRGGIPVKAKSNDEAFTLMASSGERARQR